METAEGMGFFFLLRERSSVTPQSRSYSTERMRDRILLVVESNTRTVYLE